MTYWVLSHSVVSVAQDSQPSQCVDQSALSERLIYHSVAGVPTNYVPNLSKYVEVFESTNTVIDVRQERFDQEKTKIFIEGAIKIPLHHVKTKTYLKNKEVVLVGDGLDNYFLEREIDNLLSSGFKSVKILEYGIAALIGTGDLTGSAVSSFKLRQGVAEKIVGGSIADGQSKGFLFVNLGESNGAYEKLGLNYVELQFSKSKDFFTELYEQANKAFEEDETIRLVLIHDDPAVYNDIYQSADMFNMLGLWFMSDGNQGLLNLQEKIAKVAIVSKRVKIVCAS